MAELRVRSSAGDYGVEVRQGLLRELPQRLLALGRPLFVLADGNTASLAAAELAQAVGAPIMTIEPGEASKTFGSVQETLAGMARAGMDRSGLLVAVGGGVVGDIAGVVAALYMRGIGLVHVPTSLLAQVDSAIGGKAAVNLAEGKNLVGAFKPPEAVYIDPELIASLPEREFRSGLAEIAKYSMISDQGLFDLLLSQREKILQRDTDLMTTVIERCCAIKAAVVSGDERESGQRAILNYGHTFGHALEAAAGYGTLTHGEAISVGMEVAARLGEEVGISPAGLRDRQGELLDGLGLPRRAPGACDPALALERLGHDKKNVGGAPRWVLLPELGRATWGHEIPAAMVADVAFEVLVI
jgi:3-dehydroquinate synthase